MGGVSLLESILGDRGIGKLSIWDLIWRGEIPRELSQRRLIPQRLWSTRHSEARTNVQ